MKWIIELFERANYERETKIYRNERSRWSLFKINFQEKSNEKNLIKKQEIENGAQVDEIDRSAFLPLSTCLSGLFFLKRFAQGDKGNSLRW